MATTEDTMTPFSIGLILGAATATLIFGYLWLKAVQRNGDLRRQLNMRLSDVGRRSRPL